ncbi:MAG: tRNA (adenosine(37)-N6)-threonylcarbamoyltransferase complex dimerization subunit type 1 TsaB [Chlorobiaceae bacterium]|nr:tRNA (adenosine(37)-N6)-threonylcarbamoyltransferase complex dimerization subunit type 1 TsaB [Chlorobiaceae bacterium]
MKILAIECTHQVAWVAVKNGSITVERTGGEWQKTAEVVVPLAMQAMSAAGLVPADLDGVAVSSGPGSFTALRIGMSVAKGIAYGAGCPLVPVSTLAAMARAACAHTDARHLMPVVPSRPGEYFYAIYRRDAGVPGTLMELGQGRCMVQELAGLLEPFSGDAVIPVRDAGALATHAPGFGQIALDAAFFTASSLLGLAETALGKGAAPTVGEASPDYRQIFVPLQKKQ